MIQHQESMTNFIHTLVNANGELSIEHSPEKLGDDSFNHVITIFNNGHPMYAATGHGPTDESSQEGAVALLFSQLMQRLMLDAHGFASILADGSIDFRYNEGKVGVFIHDRSLKTLTITLISK
jgi:hypothetical protein